MFSQLPLTQLAKSRAKSSLGYDFALLGLKGREARVEVIRQAAERTVAKIPSDVQESERVEMLTEVLASTYRLLDPRRRKRPMERVILSMGWEDESSAVAVDRKPLVARGGLFPLAADPLVVAEIVLPGEATVQLASKVSKDSVSCAGEDKLPRKSSRNARVGLVGLSALATLIASSALIAWLVVG